MIEFTFSLYGCLIVCFAIGYTPSRLLWQDKEPDSVTSQSNNQTLLIFAFPIGFILLNLSIFFVAQILATGVARIAPASLLGLLLVSGGLIIKMGELRGFLKIVRNHSHFLTFLFVLIVPLSAIHLLWPMLLHGWQIGYANGTDGAAYTYLGEYLQYHPWRPGSITDAVPFYYIGRPLTSYLPADALALLPITFYQAQSMTTVMVSFFSAITLGWLSQHLFAQQDARRSLFLAAIVLGIFGFHYQLYWDRSFMSHYFSLLPFLLTPVYFFLPDKPGTRLAFLFALFLTAITVYSIGLSLIQFVLIAFGLAALWLSRHISLKRLIINGSTALAALICANALLYKSEAPFFLGNTARGYDPSLKTWQNLTIKFGLLPASLPSDDLLFQLALLLIAALVAYAFLRSLLEAKRKPIYLAILLGMGGILLTAIYKDKFFFLDKAIVYFVPLLLLPLLADLKPWPDLKRKLAVIPLAVIFLIFVYNGYFMLDRFYYTIADARSSFVSDEMVKTKEDIIAKYHPRKIFAVDNLLERHHLTRVLFHDVAWQQNTAAHVWAEFGINPKSPPPSFKNYDFDLLLIGKPINLSAETTDSGTRLTALVESIKSIAKIIGIPDSNAHGTYQDALRAGIEKPILDPVDYGANKAWRIAELPGHDIYSAGASVVDFDLSWHMVTGHPNQPTHFRLAREQGAEIVFVNGGSHRWLEIDYSLRKGGTVLDATPMPFSLFTIDHHPLHVMNAHTVRVTCPDICRERVNRIKLNLPQGMEVIVSGVRFGA